MRNLKTEEIHDILSKLRHIDKLVTEIKEELSLKKYTFKEIVKIFKQFEGDFNSLVADYRFTTEDTEELERLSEIMLYIDEWEGIPTKEELKKIKEQNKE